MPDVTETTWRGLARSSPWRWRTLSFDLHRRPLHGPDHSVRASVARPGRLVIVSPSGEVDDRFEVRPEAQVVGGPGSGSAVPLPYAWEREPVVDESGLVVVRDRWSTADDPMWQDYQFVAMLDPVELADGSPPDDAPWEVGGPRPPALEVHHLDATTRRGRETWWAEVSPLPGYDPRCSCCPLLLGRVSEGVDAAVRGVAAPADSPRFASRYLVGLDVATGVCVHVEHLDGEHVGRGFSVDVIAVDDEVVLPER